MGELWARLDRLQKTTGFKIIMTAIAAAVVVAAGLVYVVQSGGDSRASDQIALADTTQIEDAALRAAVERDQRVILEVLDQDRSPQAVAIGLAVAAGVGITVIWLGLAITYIAMGLGVAVVATPLILASRYGYAGPITGEIGRILVGAAALAVCFTAVLEVLRLLLSVPTGPVFAVARNVLAEAVRMRVSLVFIVMLIFGLAAVPLLLNESVPLRYRMQNFLQYGTGGAFWVIAILTLLLSAATVNFEQRDKIIWQTVTKPVAAWHYLLGKWLGVITLNAALLVVTGSAVFLFAEYLRQQPAQGERQAYVAAGVQLGRSPISEDRRILHNQVLQARVAREIDNPIDKNSEQFDELVERYLEQQEAADRFGDDLRSAETRTQIREDLYKDFVSRYRSVPPGRTQTYVFSGLEKAATLDTPLVLRYKVESGSNRPDEFFTISFNAGGVPYERTVGLAQTLIIDDIPPTAINDEGQLLLQVLNGGDVHERNGEIVVVANPRTITFPPGGLELSYSVGGYRMNFFRVIVVLWIKLAFLSMLAITCSTALSFPVACLTAFGAFFAAESALFLEDSLEVFNPFYGEGVGPAILWVAESIGGAIIWVFRTYAELKPTSKLVQGELVSWTSVLVGVVVLSAWCAALFGIGWLVFRSRELAIYSGN
ncbi:MAG: hypothetical protein AAFX79_02200 [Planctomycetota bacterium]